MNDNISEKDTDNNCNISYKSKDKTFDENIDNIDDYNNKNFNLLNNQKIINTLRSQQSLNTDEIKYLPNMILEMQDALTRSNNNVLELKNKLQLLLNKESELKKLNDEYSKINCKLTTDIKNLELNIQNNINKEKEYSILLEKADFQINELTDILSSKDKEIK